MKNGLIIVLAIFFTGSLIFSGDECPGKNAITKMTTEMDSFRTVGPLDHSRILSGGAQLSRDGTKLTVSLSNMKEINVSGLVNDFVLPIKKKAEFIADIEFRNGKDTIVPGVYSGSSGYGQPFWAFAEVKLHQGEKGVVVSLGIMEGKAVITRMTGDSVCGTFDLRTKPGTRPDSVIRGEFSVKMERSKW